MPIVTPLTPARRAPDAPGTAHAPDGGDGDRPSAGAPALAQARHVCLGGNGLPGRWQGRERFVVLETGFGPGHAFLATWEAWRADPARCARLVFVAVEPRPLRREDLRSLHAGRHAAAVQPLADALVAAWPPATPDLHLLDFEGGRVRLMLALGEPAEWLPQLSLQADAFCLDGVAASARADTWQPERLARLGALAAEGATAASRHAAHALDDGLAAAGFEVSRAPGHGGQDDMTVAVHAPRFRAPPPAAWSGGLARPAGSARPRVLIVGAGLAGCAAAAALAAQGVEGAIWEDGPRPATAASGNAGGLMHGIFNAPDSLHARWHRAAALATARRVAPWLAEGQVAGALDGFLRLEPRLDADTARERLTRAGLDRDWVDWIDGAEAARRCGLPALAGGSGGWWFGAGSAGWLRPPDVATALWRASRPAFSFHPGRFVQRVERAGERWRLLDAGGRVLDEAPVLLLAAGHRLAPLLAASGLDGAAADPAVPWPLSAVRGQTSVLDRGTPGLRAPHRPLSGAGYALTLPDGRVLTGATSQHDDPDEALRATDHLRNLEQARRLGVLEGTGADHALPQGKVGWRAVTPDRLPLVGPPVDRAALDVARASGRRLDALRHLPRRQSSGHGLVLLGGLGSRGLTGAVLAGELAASWITGAPCPLDADTRDAVDPARWWLRPPRGGAPGAAGD